MATHAEKVLAVGEAGFVSSMSSTPRKARGTFIPQVETPRRSPRLAAKCKREREAAQSNLSELRSVKLEGQPSSSLPTPTREAIRKTVEARRGKNLLDEVHSFVQERYQDKKLNASVVEAQSSNKVKRYVLITRRMKSDDDVVGPHDALRLVVGEAGEYRLTSYDRCLEDGQLASPIVGSDLPKVMEKLADQKWVVCPGVKDYSSYKASIGYDMKRIVTCSWPPDTARDCECTVLFEKGPTHKSMLCKKCTSLKWRLSARKREHDQIGDEHRLKRQRSSSTVPFSVLSPESKRARVSNMRREIVTLRAQAKSNAQKIERMSVNDEQTEELYELIRSINSCDTGQQALQSIYREAESTGAGKGELLKAIWEEDVTDANGFYQDQQKNSKCITYTIHNS